MNNEINKHNVEVISFGDLISKLIEKELIEENMIDEITELKVHKTLYFAYGIFYGLYHLELFNPNFEAWRYGPVEVNYRYRFGNDLKLFYEEEYQDDIDGIFTKLLNADVWDLVDFSHETPPWKNAWERGVAFSKMDNNDIRIHFCKNIKKRKDKLWN